MLPFFKKELRTPKKWFHEIVSSQLDADRMDYLLRDGRMAGVQHSYDHSRLIGALGADKHGLVVDYRAEDILQSFVLALDQMYSSIYFHKMVRASAGTLSLLVRRALKLARETEEGRNRLFPGFQDRQANEGCELAGSRVGNDGRVFAREGELEFGQRAESSLGAQTRL